ncbi:MAG: hypothetical protein AAGJ35_04050 [Myxococcota bacterium]
MQQLAEFSVSQKIKAAMRGNKHLRSILIQDSNRLVSCAVLKNPGLTDAEVIRTAGNRAVNRDVIRQITMNREWMRLYQVKHGLVSNPKCPRGIAMRIVHTLNKNDLKALSKNKGAPSAVSTEAMKLYKRKL